MYDSNLRDLVLIDPIHQGADSLKIVSGYATHTMASWHIKEAERLNLSPIEITLIVGMCQLDGINKTTHDGFNSIMKRNGTPHQSNFICQYVIEGTPVHSKIYLWEKNKTPFRAFMGSANYTQSAFSRQRRELLQECDTEKALVYFESIEANTMYCNHAEIEEKIIITPAHKDLDTEKDNFVSLDGSGVEKITLSLLTQVGDVGFGSGINWGHRRNGTRRELNQMYIPLPANIVRSKFFPLEGNSSGKNNPHFSVLTDDGINFVLRVEQQNNKALTTPLNNSQIGEYFRRRIGVANGAFVTKRDLENYGRTDVTFYKLDEEQYVMDFSV